jgi:hypothetical protein
MAIQATTPEVVPATEEKVFDKVWVKRCAIMAPDPNRDANISVRLCNYRVLNEGTEEEVKELGPGEKDLRVQGLFSNAEFDESQMTTLMGLLATATIKQKMGIVTTALLDAVESIGKEEGVI